MLKLLPFVVAAALAAPLKPADDTGTVQEQLLASNAAQQQLLIALTKKVDALSGANAVQEMEEKEMHNDDEVDEEEEEEEEPDVSEEMVNSQGGKVSDAQRTYLGCYYAAYNYYMIKFYTHPYSVSAGKNQYSVSNAIQGLKRIRTDRPDTKAAATKARSFALKKCWSSSGG